MDFPMRHYLEIWNLAINKLMNQCQFIKSDGTRCEANSVNGSEYCFSHNPDFKDAKLAAVIRGGLNRKHYEAYGEPIVIEKPEDIKKLLAETINGVWTGKIPANQPANTIGFLARCWIDAHQTFEFDNRLDLIEQEMEKLKI